MESAGTARWFLPEKIYMKLIALYLPQYHPTPFNNEWWGKGFTEWQNVTRAKPQYKNHHQPRLPKHFGFYDLRVDEIRIEQAELAKQYGIHGFCYYYYRFDGKRALEMPLNKLMETGSPDFPFCICWANENWTRTWCGQNSNVLMKQNHNDEDDLQFIKEVAPMLTDKRYITIAGKPILMIYRPELWPDMKKTTKMWREYMRVNHSTEIYIIKCNSFSHDNPADFGFDAAYQFPPLYFKQNSVAKDTIECKPGFLGYITPYSDWRQFVHQQFDYKLFRGVMPGWDNTPRRMEHANIIHGSSPAEYKEWLSEAIRYTKKNFEPEEQVIFINAWNEWAEGAILEPCDQYNYQYLEATNESYKNEQ